MRKQITLAPSHVLMTLSGDGKVVIVVQRPRMASILCHWSFELVPRSENRGKADAEKDCLVNPGRVTFDYKTNHNHCQKNRNQEEKSLEFPYGQRGIHRWRVKRRLLRFVCHGN
jgi:hypothetical protein